MESPPLLGARETPLLPVHELRSMQHRVTVRDTTAVELPAVSSSCGGRAQASSTPMLRI